jgi:hypothetical protein
MFSMESTEHEMNECDADADDIVSVLKSEREPLLVSNDEEI